eukprot:768755-Hanusia_phi.AAC.6
MGIKSKSPKGGIHVHVLDVGILQLLSDRPDWKLHGPAIDLGHRQDAAHGPCGERLVACVDFSERDVPLLNLQPLLPRNLDHVAASDAGQAAVRSGGQDDTIADDEEVGGVGLRDKAVAVEHEGVVDVGVVGLDLGEDVVQQVVVVDLAVQKRRRVPADARADEPLGLQPGHSLPRRVHRRLPLREDDEARARLVVGRAHTARNLVAPRERQPDVRLVAHVHLAIKLDPELRAQGSKGCLGLGDEIVVGDDDGLDVLVLQALHELQLLAQAHVVIGCVLLLQRGAPRGEDLDWVPYEDHVLGLEDEVFFDV